MGRSKKISEIDRLSEMTPEDLILVVDHETGSTRSIKLDYLFRSLKNVNEAPTAVVLESPKGVRYTLVVDDNGNLTTEPTDKSLSVDDELTVKGPGGKKVRVVFGEDGTPQIYVDGVLQNNGNGNG